jgi:electron transport complex protein RnfD
MTQPEIPPLELRGGPFLHDRRTTRGLMIEVILSLLPVIIVASVVFGPVVLASCLATSAGALCAERWGRSASTQGQLRDGSALITGLLLALTLPPALPLWMCCLGGAVAIGAGKMVFGGLGQNPFNPALVGRAFLQAAFPTAITSWTAPGAAFAGLAPAVLSPPFIHGASVDMVSAATPLGMAKFQHQATPLGPLLWGNVAGSIGETSAIVLIVVGAWLALRRVADYRPMLGTLLSVAVCSGLLHLWLPERCPDPAFMLLSGGLLLATVFMVTDPVTTPVTPLAAWIFGAGVGLLVVLIRVFGGLPEGVMYAVLLMNAATPLLDRFMQPRPFGAKVRA